MRKINVLILHYNWLADFTNDHCLYGLYNLKNIARELRESNE